MVSKEPRLARRVEARASALAQEDRRALEALTVVSQMVAGDLDLQSVLGSAMHAAAAAMNAEACSILLREAEGAQLRFHIVDGPRTEGLARASVPIDDHSIAGWVANHQAPLLIADPYADSRFNRDYDRQTGFRTRSIICVPMAAKGQPVGVMQILNRRDGRPFEDHDLALAQAVGSLIAVAIHNAREHQARLKAERLAAIGETIAGLAHCVKNILNGLQGGSYIIDQNLAGDVPPGVATGWKMVKRNMQLLSNIVLNMLSASKDRKPVFRPCRLSDLCEDVAALLRDQAAEKHVTIVTSGDPAEVWVDEAGIRRCLINLVGNAIDACGEQGGLVRVEAAAEAGDHFVVRVRDNGCGMDAATRQRIFEGLYSTKGGKGTGLGLSVTQKIVKEHGGSIRVESAPGEGTEFALVLPVRQTDEAAGPAHAAP